MLIAYEYTIVYCFFQFSNGLRPQASDVEVGEQFQSEAQLER